MSHRASSFREYRPLDTIMNNGYLQLVSQSSFTALTTADIKSHLNVSDSSWDAYIATLLTAAVAYVERRLQLDLRTTTWALVLDQFPIWGNADWYDRYGGQVYLWPGVWEHAIGRVTQRTQEIELRRGPLQSITSVVYYDTNNTTQTLASSSYAFTTPSYQPGRVEPVTVWPVAYPRPNAVTITFVTGFGTVPSHILHAIKLIVGGWWVNRESLMYGPDTALKVSEQAVDCLLGTMEVKSYA